jgi:flavin reductase (DIM6/NTAB) family NADH-FMN oxidoreductase RutF
MRQPVLARHAYKLLGATTLVSSAHGEKRNVMAAAWVMALDYAPPKLAAVIAEGTYTRELVDASQELAICIPSKAMLDETYAVGSHSGRTVDKLAKLKTFAGEHVKAPLIEGCVAWLECRVLETLPQYDLFICEVLAASADDIYFADGEWKLAETLHHVNKGVFFATGERLEARKLGW